MSAPPHLVNEFLLDKMPAPLKSTDHFCQKTTNPLEEMQKRLIFLEESDEVMRTRIQSLVYDNKMMNNQLKIVLAKNKQLQQINNEISQRFQSQNKGQDDISRIFKDVETSMQFFAEDKGVQITSLCELCQGKLENIDFDGPSLILQKSEVEKLERDMKILRDVVVAKEQAWDKFVEREKMYMHQIAELSREVVTNRHHLDCRNNDLQTFNQELVNKKLEVQDLRREVAVLKKQVEKLKEKLNSRKIEQNVETSLEPFIEELKERLTSSKSNKESKPKSNSRDRSQASSPSSSSQQTTPRGTREKNVLRT